MRIRALVIIALTLLALASCNPETSGKPYHRMKCGIFIEVHSGPCPAKLPGDCSWCSDYNTPLPFPPPTPTRGRW